LGFGPQPGARAALFNGWCAGRARCGRHSAFCAAHAADVRNVIEAVLQILYEGASLATLNAASVNMTKVVRT